MNTQNLQEIQTFLTKYKALKGLGKQLRVQQQKFKEAEERPGASTLKPMETRRIVLTDGGLN